MAPEEVLFQISLHMCNLGGCKTPYCSSKRFPFATPRRLRPRQSADSLEVVRPANAVKASCLWPKFQSRGTLSLMSLSSDRAIGPKWGAPFWFPFLVCLSYVSLPNNHPKGHVCYRTTFFWPLCEGGSPHFPLIPNFKKPSSP